MLKSQKLNQEKELSSNVTGSIAYEDPRVQEQRDLALQNGYSKEDADEVAASYHYYYSRLDEIERDVIAEGKPANGADYELRAEEARKNLNQDLNLIDYKYEAAKDAPVQKRIPGQTPIKTSAENYEQNLIPIFIYEMRCKKVWHRNMKKLMKIEKKLGSFRQSGKYYSPVYSSNYERRTKRN